MTTRPNFLLVTFATVLSLSIQLAAQTNQTADPFVAVVRKVTGPVRIQRAGAGQEVPLKADDRLYPGDRLFCGDGGQASLIFSDSAVELKLLPNTELTFQGQRSQVGVLKEVFLHIGRLLTSVIRGDMEVVTPTSVASVKGTRWWTTVEATQLTRVVVLEGEVKVENRISGQVETVSAGNTASSTATGELEVTPSKDSDLPEDPSGNQQGSLDIEFENGSGESKTLHIEFDR